MTLYDCPDCGLPATAESRDPLPSTDGGIEHVYVRCIQGDWFLGPADTLRVHLQARDEVSQ